jgi:hypothetical protein
MLVVSSGYPALYRVQVKVANQPVKRNIKRFFADFMFQLTAEEANRLRSRSVILTSGRGQHGKYLLHVFTEQGVSMYQKVTNDVNLKEFLYGR